MKKIFLLSALACCSVSAETYEIDFVQKVEEGTYLQSTFFQNDFNVGDGSNDVVGKTLEYQLSTTTTTKSNVNTFVLPIHSSYRLSFWVATNRGNKRTRFSIRYMSNGFHTSVEQLCRMLSLEYPTKNLKTQLDKNGSIIGDLTLSGSGNLSFEQASYEINAYMDVGELTYYHYTVNVSGIETDAERVYVNFFEVVNWNMTAGDVVSIGSPRYAAEVINAVDYDYSLTNAIKDALGKITFDYRIGYASCFDSYQEVERDGLVGYRFYNADGSSAQQYSAVTDVSKELFRPNNPSVPEEFIYDQDGRPQYFSCWLDLDEISDRNICLAGHVASWWQLYPCPIDKMCEGVTLARDGVQYLKIGKRRGKLLNVTIPNVDATKGLAFVDTLRAYGNISKGVSSITIYNPIVTDSPNIDPGFDYPSYSEKNHLELRGKRLTLVGDSQYNNKVVAQHLTHAMGLIVNDAHHGGHHLAYTEDNEMWFYRTDLRHEAINSKIPADIMLMTMSTNDRNLVPLEWDGVIREEEIQAVLENYPTIREIEADDQTAFNDKMAKFESLSIADRVEIFKFVPTYCAYLRQVKDMYPDAELYMATVPLDVWGMLDKNEGWADGYSAEIAREKNDSKIRKTNEAIRIIAEVYGCKVIDFYNECGLTYENRPYHSKTPGDGTHWDRWTSLNCAFVVEAAFKDYRNTTSFGSAIDYYSGKVEMEDAFPWEVDIVDSHDGVSSLKWPATKEGSAPVRLKVDGSGELVFWWKGDVVLSIDGIERTESRANSEWSEVKILISESGTHLMTWTANGLARLDEVRWIPADGSGKTATTEVPVPYSWLEEHDLVKNYDYEDAAHKTWKSYLIGTDPANPDEAVLKVDICMEGTRPVVTWTPNLNRGGGGIRRYRVWGSPILDGRWREVDVNNIEDCRFFKVTVEIP